MAKSKAKKPKNPIGHAAACTNPKCRGKCLIAQTVGAAQAAAAIPADQFPAAQAAGILIPPAAPVGAPCKLTPELQKRICNFIHGGTYIETAVVAAGIRKSTFYKWLEQAAEDLKAEKTTKFTEFSDAVEKALAEAELADINRIGIAAVGRAAEYDKKGNLTKAEVVPQWQAAAWRLERKFPRKYGRQDRLEHSGPGGGPIPLRQATPDEVAAQIRKELEDVAQATPSEGFG